MPDLPLIRVKNLSKTYKNNYVETPALHGVSFDINKGEFVAIMGPSGSGKSTLLHILGFLDRPTGGEYFFEGREMDDFSDDELAKLRNKKIGFVFQTFNLLRRTALLDNVELPLAYSDIPAEEHESLARKALAAVGLKEKVFIHEPSQLSGGEQQRGAIARAIVNGPSVIFADEPTGNLDSRSGETVMETLRNLNDGGNTIILVTHDVVTAGYAKRMIKMRDGRIEEDVRV